MPVIRRWLESLAENTFELNQKNILELVRNRTFARICDLGCDDGSWSASIAEAVRAVEVFGVEIASERAQEARRRGINVAVADLNQALPFCDASFDMVHANQVIEHVANLDIFLTEVHRVLHPGGTVIISTENCSSWHNVVAAAMGWQIFSLTNISPRVSGVGNPFALHRGEAGLPPSWTHKTIFSYRGLLEMLRVYHLRPVASRGAGYHPLPPIIGNIDPRHAHVLAILAVALDDQ